MAFMLLSAISPVLLSQGSHKVGPNLAEKCRPKVISRSSLSRPDVIQHRKGGKATVFSPIVAFEITESGNVQKARIKRSSGIADLDAYALSWILSTKHKDRPGCGVVVSQTSVDIHL